MAVLALDGWGYPVFFHAGQLFQLDGLSGGGGEGQLFNVGDAAAVVFFEAADDVVFVTILFQESAVHAVYAVADTGGYGGTG